MEGVEKAFYTPLAGERLRPLGHLSVSALIGANALLIKRFFTLLVENAKIYVCCFLQQKPERLVNSLAQTAHLRHTVVLQAFRTYIRTSYDLGDDNFRMHRPHECEVRAVGHHV